eukprot:gene36750-47907_t
MILYHVLQILALCSIQLIQSESHIENKILDTSCGIDLTIGSTVKSSRLVVDDSVSIFVHRGSLQLSSLDYYTPGESLTVTFSTSSKAETLLETINAKFVVSVWAVLADSEDTVRLTPTIILQPAAITSSPLTQSSETKPLQSQSPIDMLSMTNEPSVSLIMDINHTTDTKSSETKPLQSQSPIDM